MIRVNGMRWYCDVFSPWAWWLYIHRAQKSGIPSNICRIFTDLHAYSRVSTFATLPRIKTNRQLGQISSLANARGYMSTKDFVHQPQPSFYHNYLSSHYSERIPQVVALVLLLIPKLHANTTTFNVRKLLDPPSVCILSQISISLISLNLATILCNLMIKQQATMKWTIVIACAHHQLPRIRAKLRYKRRLTISQSPP
ncbi:hypothetical protein F5878DRAFT_404884 [Lentinula raphanica]|uniref:Uncharacterized protein n=1 Tax=Lentinula raphanica TaxID=153919 RepID=A0AA38NZT8_9AGAR|nr:hypothetical protein F5878DRAFT_404884 [Lentinula raphanica]